MLGTDLVRSLQEKTDENGKPYDIIPTDIDELSVTDDSAVRELTQRERPHVIINCAAFTNVDKCETERGLAFAVNAGAAGILARAARDIGARLIHVSTDFVFDGKKRSCYIEEDRPRPLNVYGKTKLEGERLVRKSGCRFAIVRTAWLYGEHGKNFVDTMLKLASEKPELSVVDDEIGSPTWTADLAEALVAVMEKGCEGVFHAVNAGSCSRFEQAEKIMELAGRDIPIHPIKSSQYKRAAKVPARSVLNCDKLAREAGYSFRPWDEALRDYLHGKGASH